MAGKGKYLQVGAAKRTRSTARAEDKARKGRLRAADRRALKAEGA